MRLALTSLIAIASLAPAAFAQSTAPEAPPAPPSASTAALPASAAPITPAPAPATALPATAAPMPPPGPMAPPPAAVAGPPAAVTPLVAVPTPEAPPAPPAAPTDPTAIALLNTLDTVCIPSANGGNLAGIAKVAGYRKSGDNFVLKRPGYQFTVLAPGSNPTKCQVTIVHPVDPEAPAKPLVVALHNWAAVTRGWDLYRNDKNVQGAQELTTRSWEHSADGKNEALVLTTFRKADGTPSQRAADTSEMIYSVTKTP